MRRLVSRGGDTSNKIGGAEGSGCENKLKWLSAYEQAYHQ